MADLLVDGLAAFRLARLVTTDGIAQRPRSAVKRWAVRGEHRKVLELLDCPWCVGFWCALAVQLLPRRARGVLAAAAVSGIVGQELG